MATSVSGTTSDDLLIPTVNDATYRGGAGNDTYILTSAIPASAIITISDTEGTNRIQLVDGLSIQSSSFLNNATELTLSSGAKIRILGAVNFVYDVGANATSGDVAEHPNASYSEFAAALGASVPAPGAPAVVGPPVVIGPGPVSSYTLASSTDVAIEGSTVTFTVTRTDTTAEKTLTFNTVGDTNGGTVNAATPGTDSTPASGAVTFAAGAATATFTINVTADLVSEGLEGLKVSLFDGLTSITSKTVLINEDPITYNLTASPSNVNEGATVTFTLATTGVADGTVLPYTLSGTGITTDDVTGGLTGTATVLSNKATITVPVVADFTTEGDESLTLALDSGKASVSALIKDTSTTPVFTVAAGAASVDEAANATFNLTADNAAFNGTVDYTLSGTGITADDVVPASLTGKATFVNGVSSVTVALADDSTTEGTETMTLTLGGKSDSIAVKDISVTPAMGDDTVAGTIVAGQGTAIFTPAEVTAFRNNDLTNRGVSSTGTVNIDFGSGQGGQVVELKNGNTMFVADSGVRVGSFKYSVSDIAGLQGTVNVTLDTAPTIDPIADQAILEGASTKITPVVADADGDALTTTATDGKYGTVVDNKDGTFTYTHTDTNTAGTDLKAGEVVNDTFVLTTTDPYGLSASTTVKVAVTGTEDPPPPYTLTAASTSVNEGASATFNLVSTGVAAGTLVPYTLTGVSAADVTGGLTGKATIGADGKATITVPVVADATTENVTETLTVTLDGTTVSASTIVNDTSVGPEASYYLLKTQDIATANKFFGSQTYFNVDGVGPTLNTGDFLTGTAGRIDNTLTVTDLTPGVANGNIPAGVTLLNIQNVILNSSNNTSAGTGFSTVGYADVRNLTVTTNGDLPDLIAAKNGTDGTVVTATHNGFAVAGNMTVVGGTDVTTTSVGGNIVVGSPAQARVPLSTEVATGAIVVNQNSTSTGLVGVFGGTTVNVTTSSTSNTGTINVGNTPANTGNTSSGILANPSGNINVKTSGTGVVTVFGGQDIVVTDSALKGAGAITVGDVTRVDSDNQPAGTVTINEAAQIAYNGLAGSSNNNTASGTIGVFGGTNVSVTTNAANAVNIGNLGAVKENSLNPTGTISVTNTGVVNSAAGVAATAAAIAGATPASVAAAMAGTAFATVANTAAAAGGATAASVSAAVAAATPPVEGAVLITGGTDVTVSTTGANVTIGRAANAVVDQVSNPTGNVSVTETMNGNGAARTVTVDGGAAVTVNAKGQNVNIGTAVNSAPTGAVTVTQSDMLTGNGAYLAGTNAGNVTVDGGTSVTVNTTGGNVVVGAVVGGVNTVPSGAVGITRTFSGPGQDTTAVLGGTTVDITTTKTRGGINIGTASDTLNAAGSALKDAALAPTGNVNIVNATTVGSTTAYGTSVSQIRTNGAQTVSVKGADVDAIIDIQSTLATGGSNAGKAVGVSALKNVVMEGLAFNDGFVLRSDALESLSVLNTQGGANTITITNNTAAHPLSITQGGNSAALWVNGAPINNAVSVVDAKATSVTVTDNGTASTAVLAVQAVKATDLTVNNTAAATVNLNLDAELKNITLKGTGAVTLQNVGTLGKIASIDALASSGAVTTDLTVTSTAGVSQKFTGGTGKATLTVSSNAFSYGNQVLLTGGSGSTDVIVANYVAAGTDLAMGNTAAVKGFEFLGLGTLANGTYDATGFTGVTLGAVAGAPTLTNMAKDASLSITAAPGFATTLTPSAATLGTTDGLTINLNTNTVNAITGETVGINANTVTANGYETLSIVSNGAGGNKQILANTMTLVDTGTAGTGTLAISGTGKLTLTDASTRFSSIAVTNSTAVDLDAVVVSNKGAAISGGAGSLKATGATGGTEVVVVSLGATAGSATPFAIADTAEVVIDGTTFTYTVAGAAASTATVATGLAALINAGATGVVATASGGNVVLTKAALFSATVFQSVNTGTGTVAASLVGGGRRSHDHAFGCWRRLCRG
ncbi:hypothetical protein E4Q08_19285 [Candidatus Accumulibacter phosphatis]|uniref:Calx-beta domain-containing protein n=1 Tax=Candidatus Accumulibacter contiguus TaxID=2954381 RepID=A0ABX1TDU8_9PROT|nr:VCBS domain-containing protein [Candidatus Accumulibacter contiguus]NMQ07229.1 hypothetical protein [Candidatus Accumulibacter contiguus]